ncbi:hypothetical protein JCM19237_1011 [Photobacterium aphoticum]|uniref:Uncharacterized protein n=1 Tax=Photobacterium aphoticum TaxID=754436 RepID=A0A090QR88_9GAMM|nr:hypothetical protein JCM19237_1011 [Photobacterium aphoticum]
MDHTEQVFWILIGACVVLYIAFKLIDKWKAKSQAKRQ